MKELDTNVTSEEWLARKKWTKFLMSLPLGKSRTFEVVLVGEHHLHLIRVTAAAMSTSDTCDRKFSVITDAERKYFTITTSRKTNDQATAAGN